MSDDSVTVTSSRSWLSRIGGAISGALFGIVLFLGSFVLLSWNEGRAIHRAKTLEAGARLVVTVPAGRPDPANNGRLVHFSGNATAEGPAKDPVFGITAEALKLRRSVEMYQWKETQKSETKQKLGGGEETKTTYSYSREWSDTLIDSSRFQNSVGHKNPGSMPVEGEVFEAPGIHVGGFELPQSLAGLIAADVPRPATPEEARAAAERHEMQIRAGIDGSLFIGADPGSPEVGDLRIRFHTAPSGPVSVVAGQSGSTLEPFAVKGLGSVELLMPGTLSADEMFQQEQANNSTLTWFLRLAGFLMMLFGLLLITGIFGVAASVIPFAGRIVGAGAGLLAFLIALPLSLLTIAAAWIAFRPLVAIPALVLAAGSFAVGIALLRRRAHRATANH